MGVTIGGGGQVVATTPVEARPVRPWLWPVVAVAALLYAAGWVAAQVWLLVSWCVAAVQVGWVEGRR